MGRPRADGLNGVRGGSFVVILEEERTSTRWRPRRTTYVRWADVKALGKREGGRAKLLMHDGRELLLVDRYETVEFRMALSRSAYERRKGRP